MYSVCPSFYVQYVSIILCTVCVHHFMYSVYLLLNYLHIKFSLVSVLSRLKSWLLHQFRISKLALIGKHTGEVWIDKHNILHTGQQ
jgi:hypothetical protein